jgi:hypothetical protein
MEARGLAERRMRVAYRYKDDPTGFTFDGCYSVADRLEPSDRRNRMLLVNLIDLLVSKGLITEAEVVADLFEETGNFEVAPAPENEARTPTV